MTETRLQAEERYREFGAALDCLERLTPGQLKLLAGAIKNEQEERSKQDDHIVDANKMALIPL